MSGLQTGLKPENSPLDYDLSPPGPRLLVAFAGIRGELGIPRFEFFNVLKGVAVKKAFIRDIDRCLYHRGLRGLSRNIPETVPVLRRLIEESGASHVTFVGNSKGGYAALLFGALLNVDVVHAFSPQTFVNLKNRVKFGETRNLRLIIPFYFRTLFLPKFYDLKPTLSSLNFDTRLHLHYGLDGKTDQFHAEHLKNIRGVVMHPYATSKTELMKRLRDSGELAAILSDENWGNNQDASPANLK